MKTSPKTSARKTSYSDGVLYEGMAELYLWGKGFRILERRYKTGVGEVDLIALDREILVFIEVKGRKTEAEALFSITPRMKSRITAAACHFLAENPLHAERAMRFDVVTVCPPFSIRHLDNAWEAAA
jgi:putative endonuclease